MSKKDLEELFELVNVGDKVEIRAERDEQIAAIFVTDSEGETMGEVRSELGNQTGASAAE